MDKRVFVIGNGMTKFIKPSDKNPDYPDMAKQAIQRALMDANICYSHIDLACAGYVYGDSAYGQRAIYGVGMTGIPIYNLNNNCATGASTLHLAHEMIKGGRSHCALAIGFEKMETGSLGVKYMDRTNPLDLIFKESFEILQKTHPGPYAPQIFGNAGNEHMQKYGTQKEHFAKVAHKNHLHSINSQLFNLDPYAQFQKEYSLEEIKKSPNIYGPLTKLQCCPTSDGAGAAILCDLEFVQKHHLEDQAVEIVAMSLVTDPQETFSKKSFMSLAGYDMTAKAASQAFQKAKISVKDVAVCELHDCFSANELITYEGLGLCPVGKAGEFIDKNAFTYGGNVVVNPSGGLISKGHPLGATGLAQCAELCWQLRNMAAKRQVNNAWEKYALQHNLGLGGACVVALYKRLKPTPKGFSRENQTQDPNELEKYEKAQFKSKL